MTIQKDFSKNKLCISPTFRVPVGIARFGVGEWDSMYGNHRAVVNVTHVTDAVCAYLPWRRRDAFPQTKHVLVMDANHEIVKNSIAVSCNKEYGEVVFQPVAGHGEYYIYYLPPCYDKNAMISPRVFFPIHRYIPAHISACEEWLKKHHLTIEELQTIPRYCPEWPMTKDPYTDVYTASWRKLPEAELVEFQSLGQWNSFYPMETICTVKEQRQLVKMCEYRPFILFPEDRKNPIRMKDQLPYSWVVRDELQLDNFSGCAQRNEYYIFQIGVYASKERLEKIQVSISDLISADGQIISSKNTTCFNLCCVDQYGKSFTKIVNVDRGKVQALWFGIDIPESAKPGVYKAKLTISASRQSQTVNVEINVEDKVIEDRGDSDGWRLSRLRWINSRRAVDDGICDPFTPIELNGTNVRILGREIELTESAMLKQVTSFIDMFDIVDTGREVLAAHAELILYKNDQPITLQQQAIECTHQSLGVVKFVATAKNDELTLMTETVIEMEGYIGQSFKLEVGKNLSLDNIVLQIPINQDVAKYEFGDAANYTGTKRGAEVCSESFERSLENCSLLWLGDYNAGLSLQLQNNNLSWCNDGKGKIKHLLKNSQRLLQLETGAITLMAGMPQTFTIDLSVTPYKPVPKKHWDWKYCQPAYDRPADIDKGIAAGAKIFTIHHAKPENPYISYPFDIADRMKNLADKAHANGGLFKAYYTLRELSTKAPEIWALRSFGHEILTPLKDVPAGRDLCYEELSQLPLEYQIENPFGTTQTGQVWMCEHFVSDYKPCWHSLIMDGDEFYQDSSVKVNGASRWSNFWIEGLHWLMENADFDGLYLDGTTFDRESFKRIRKTLMRRKPYALVDCHNPPIDVMPQMPYFDSIWYGEGAQYHREPAYWLIMVSGLAFGVPGELLESHASVQRGMVYGLCQRLDWMPIEQVNPESLWKWWDSFDIRNAKMIGYWADNCPVATDNDNVKATAYVHKGQKIAIAIASWADMPTTVSLDINWQAIELDPQDVTVVIPEIDMFQSAVTNPNLDAITIDPDKGYLIEIFKNKI